jgi:hypothetical protein
MQITIELTGIELDALQRALTEEHGEDTGKTAEEFVRDCVLEQFYCHDALYREAVVAEEEASKLVLAMLGVAAKLERRRIKERTARGRADAKANGVKFGRKPKLTPHQKREAIKRRDKDEETLRSIGRSYNVSAATISRLGT